MGAGLLNDQLKERDLFVCFNLSIQTQIDEIDKNRHIKGTFIEFLEAFARAMDKASWGPMDLDPEVEPEWPLEVRVA